MNTPDERFTITLPDTWTPEQALAIFELLNDITSVRVNHRINSIGC